MNNKRRSFLTTTAGLMAGVALGGSGVASAASTGPSPVARTGSGKLRGLIEPNGVLAFRGIPYADSPAGVHRFKPPRPVTPWSGIRDATAFGPMSVQPDLAANLSKEVAEAFDVAGSQPAIGEDCQVLNVWTPALDGKRRPVMVWIHGGGFTAGYGSVPERPFTWGDKLAQLGDVVVVTLNHRLGALGYLYLAELGGKEYLDSGNAGMLDLIAALSWVKENIGEFGGDPRQVTLFGESGGGAKISNMMAMPAATGLFRRAIIQSGPGIRMIEPDYATELAGQTMTELGLGRSDIEALIAAPIGKIIDAQGRAHRKMIQTRIPGLGGRGGFAPVVDGRSLPVHPFSPVAAPGARGIDLIIGSTKDEAIVFLLGHPKFGKFDMADVAERFGNVFGEHAEAAIAAYRSAFPVASPTDLIVAMESDDFRIRQIALAERKRAAAPDDALYMYEFAYETDLLGGVLKSMHALDVCFVFNTAERSKLSGTRPERMAVAERMATAWTNFARSGDPNAAGSRTWPPYATDGSTVRIFDVEPGLKQVMPPQIRSAWATVALD